MQPTLLSKVRNIRTLGRAWSVICDNGRSSQSVETRREIEEFAIDAIGRITTIQRQLNSRSFKFHPAKGVEAKKPGKSKTRPIVIAPIESRIVQRAIHDVLLSLPTVRQYAESPNSFGGVRRQRGNALAAVPAAISAVLEAIGNGAKYAIRCDISSFFTRIQKPTVTALVANATNDPEFMNLFVQAITVELENMASLRERAEAFPIHEIGVAQGNSLSPLLGNMLLRDFDNEMNAGCCRCIRYIDDFIILAPERDAAERQFSRGREILAGQGLEVSSDKEKTFNGYIKHPFGFLGIDFANGAVRPSKESRNHLLANISEVLQDSARAFRALGKVGTVIPSLCLIRTLNETRGVLQGWGNHYSFCNEKNLFHQLDIEIDKLVRAYLGAYASARKKADDRGRRRLLGVPLLEEFVVKPFKWPKENPAAQFATRPAPIQTAAAS